MFNTKNYLKTQLPLVFLASFGLVGSANAGLDFSISVHPIQANYSIETPYLEPNLLSGSSKTYTHKVVSVDLNPNDVQAQRRIRQGWYKDDDQTRYCIHANGNIDASCSWQNFSLNWNYQYSYGTFDEVDVYTSTVSMPGNAWANWPLFPADEAAYAENPNFVYHPPKTRYIIETRFYHPTVGWLYSEEIFDLFCNGQLAWQHWSGQTTCPGL